MPSIEELAGQLNSNDQPTVYRAKRALAKWAATAGAPGKAGERGELAAALAKAETAKNEKGDASKYDAKARGELARTMSEVAGDAEVPALKETLNDFDAREMARFALDRMTCQAATDALCEAALNAVGVEFRIGAINALGRRSGSQVVDVLKGCAGDNDPEIRLAAVEALANHSDVSADPLMAEVGKQPGQRAGLRATKARVRLAAKLSSVGQKDAARQIYHSIAQSDAAAPAQKKAANIALAQLG
jgi:hypothetical protein